MRLRRWSRQSALILPLLSSALVIATPGIAEGAGDKPKGSFQQPVIDVKQRAEYVEFTVRMIPEHQRTRTPHPIPYTAETFNLTVALDQDTLREADLFGTGLTLDLNGDGDQEDTFSMACTRRGSLRLGRTKVKAIGTLSEGGAWVGRYPKRTSSKRFQPWGRQGASIVLYEPCRTARLSTVGVEPAGSTLAIKSTPGPALQIMVGEVVANASTMQSFVLEDITLDGLKPKALSALTSHSYERQTLGGGQWLAFQWYMIPLNPTMGTQTFRAILKGDQPASHRFIVAIVNESSKTRHRERTASHAVHF